MTNIRMMPPNSPVFQKIAVNGRAYAASPGAVVDVPIGDADVLGANGWTRVCQVGTTAQRPATPFPGQQFHDTTLALTIVFEGTAWRNPATGAVV